MGAPQAERFQFLVRFDFRPRAWRTRNESFYEGTCPAAWPRALLGAPRSGDSVVVVGGNGNGPETAPGAGFKEIADEQPRSRTASHDCIRWSAGVDANSRPSSGRVRVYNQSRLPNLRDRRGAPVSSHTGG